MQVDDYDLPPKYRFIWWTARILAVTGILLCAFVLPQMASEIVDRRFPFFSNGGLFGNPSEPARLGILALAIGYGLALIGYIVSFWRERIASHILLASGVVQIILAAISLSGPTRSPRRQCEHPAFECSWR